MQQVWINTVYVTSAEIKAVKHEYRLDNYLIRASNDDLLFPFPKITLIINYSTTGIAGRIEQLGCDNDYYDYHKIYN